MRSAFPHDRGRRLFLGGLLALGLPGTGQAAPAPVVTILGDSITAGYGLRAEDALPAQLQAALARVGVRARVRGAGVSGDTTAGGLARVDFSVQPDTRVCVVALGGNDLLQGLDPQAMKANLERLVRRLQARRIGVVLCGLRAPSSLNAGYAREFNAVFPAVARAEGVAALSEPPGGGGAGPGAEPGRRHPSQPARREGDRRAPRAAGGPRLEAAPMMRLFAAVAVPPEIGEGLTRRQQGLPGARWRPLENLHITLRFFGETAEPLAHDLDAELSAIAQAPFEIGLEGVGAFGEGRDVHAVWAGVGESEPLRRLAGRCEAAARRAGLKPDKRIYRPHVTLAYLKRADPARVGAWIQGHNLLKSPPFRVTWFGLYSSWSSSEGSRYDLEREYPLI